MQQQLYNRQLYNMTGKRQVNSRKYSRKYSSYINILILILLINTSNIGTDIKINFDASTFKKNFFLLHKNQENYISNSGFVVVAGLLSWLQGGSSSSLPGASFKHQ